MAVGTVVLAETTILSSCATLGGSYAPISDINTYNVQSDRTIDSFPVFMQAAHQVPKPRTVKITLNGYLSTGDSGQVILVNAERAGGIVFVKLLPDGTNGDIFPVRVGTRTQDGDAAGGLTKVSYQLAIDGDPHPVGTGTGWSADNS